MIVLLYFFSTVGEMDGYTPMVRTASYYPLAFIRRRSSNNNLSLILQHGAGFQGRSAIAQMLKDHGVPLREKHPGDGHEPASKCNQRTYLVLNLFFYRC